MAFEDEPQQMLKSIQHFGKHCEFLLQGKDDKYSMKWIILSI
jgi:hypothetical protein